jgi:Peptidase A4 family
VRLAARLLAGLVCIAAALAASHWPATAAAGSSRDGLHQLAGAASVSSNWAGYAVTAPGTTYTSVTATWTQPAVTCDSSQEGSESAFWVGLGGYNSNSQALEQVGSDSDCSALGQPTYFAWFELVPAPAVELHIKIFPGNTITASVNAIDDDATMELQLIDRSRGTRVTKLLPAGSPDLTSAEWIAEAPAECTSDNSCQVQALADFGSVAFSRIAALGNGIGGTVSDPAWTADAIELEPSPAHRGFFPGPEGEGGSSGSSAGAAPGALSSIGNAFSVAWVADANTAVSGSH